MTTLDIEHVLVVPTPVFHRVGHFQGFCADPALYLGELLRAEHMSYRPRPEMEQDPTFKQLIPYVVFRYDDRELGPLLFQYTRGSGQGERRLHAKRSIGVGGHISSQDASSNADDPYVEGLRRELEEEVEIGTPYTSRLVGLINDDESPVGRVHLGVVHLFQVEAPQVRPREVDLLDAGFRPFAELLAEREQFETWSQYALDALR